MKTNLFTSLRQLLLIGIISFLANSCEKPVSPEVLPVLSTTEVSLVTEATAQSGGFISSDAGYEITSRGVCWSVSPNPTITDSITKDAAGTGKFTSTVTGLTPNTTYYLRAYATNKKGTAYGLQETFTTKSLGITTKQISDTTINSAKSGGVIAIASDSTNIIERGICWNIQPNPTTQHFKSVDGKGKGEFDSEMTALNLNTQYYVRAYIINSSGTYYGNEISFKTKDGVIKLSTEDATSITANSATVYGNILVEGGAPVTERGFCISKSPNPTIENKIANTSNSNTFATNFSGLIHNTTYYVRAYAINSVGTYYGNEISFISSDGVVSISTVPANSISATTASSGGNITDNGGSTVTARGVCWGTNPNPTIDKNNKTNNGSGNGIFSSSITGLLPETTYYVSAYAINSIGTYYGNEISFTTGNDPAPVVALNENFESFTTGTGDAYFSTQTDNKGWFGFKIQGTLEADLRTFNTNKYVQFSAHRTAITTSTEQEFWLLSPHLDLSAATSKQLSFSTAAGFFNASTVFEVYVIDGNTPTSPKTKLEGWRIPVAADLSGSYTPFIPSGIIDLSSYTGVKRIGFYYKGISGTGNSTTYQLDNFIFGDIPTLTVTPASLTFAHGGEVKTFTVAGNRSWNAVSSDPTNFAVSVSGATVTVTAAANTTGASRTATITVTATDNSVTKTVALSQAAQTAAGANIVNNGSFENWTGSAPDGWTFLSSTVTGSVNTAETTLVSEGTKAFKLDATRASGTVNWSQTVAVTGGKKYQLSMSYYIVSGDGTDARIWSNFKKGDTFFTETELQATGLYSKLRGPGNTSSSGSSYFPDVKATWNTYTIDFDAPADATGFDFQFRIYRTAVVIWDNFTLKEI